MQPSPVTISCRRLHEGANIPSYQSDQAAGLDLTACPSGEASFPIRIAPMQRVLVPTGIAISLPRGYEAQVRPRSGWALRDGMTVLNSPGTVDSDYRGEIQVILINLGQKEVCVYPGDRIAQLVIAPVCTAQFVEAQVLDDTNRGSSGFGHTGGF